MSVVTVIDLPEFDTGLYEDCELLMSAGDAFLTIRVAEVGDFRLHFVRVRWHRYTSVYACPADWVKGCYFKVGEVTESLELRAHLAADRATLKPYMELHHFRIFIDEAGCHEFLAERADAL